MKKSGCRKLGLALALAVVSGVAWAGAPDVQITAPAGTVYLTIPGTTNITVTVTHSDTGAGVDPVQNFDVRVGTSSLIGGPIADPFTQTACNAGMPAVCSVSGDTATVTIPWNISAPGEYAIAASARHGGCATCADADEEAVTVVALVSAEFPAPPAVANDYLKQMYGKAIKSGVRGCIISQIANLHAKESKYGPKGGPYDEVGIRSDAETLLVGACAG